MWVFHAWQPNGSSPWPEWKETMGFALMPTQYGQAPHYVSLSGGWALSISSYSKHPELAWDFIKDAASAKELATFNKYIGGIAVRDDEANYSIYSNIPFIKYFTSVMKYTHYRPAFPEYPKISYQIDLAMENVMLNRPVEETMKGYADAVKGIVGPDKVECIK
jgi:multiple sugar transport system substrate-binding protein